MYIAHLSEEKDEAGGQPVSEHLKKTSEYCKEYGDVFNNGRFAAECGLLHDLGKYSTEFQDRIKKNGKKCDHSTAGARIAYQKSLFGKLAAYCIAGHHGGLPDGGSFTDAGGEGTLFGRLSDNYKIPDCRAYENEIDLSKITLIPQNINKINGNGGFTFAFFTHMIYSCLTDGDFLDTEHFMTGGKERKYAFCGFEELKKRLDYKLAELSEREGDVNKKRTEILNKCIMAANRERGLFSLTVPTGGGKTLSSISFAISHLIANGLRRIIYVIPYTSIIEQNAKVFSDILGVENILEHHSNYDFNHNENSVEKYKHLATENWDMPIIITTNVQFFESIFSNKSSKNRKLHNIANSIIIFDEVQMFPVEYLKPCIASISELIYNYRCTAVLCSATQPALDKFFPPELKMNEISEDIEGLYQVFSRTKIEDLGNVHSEMLAELMMVQSQCLTIVNTRKHAKKIYRLLSGDGNFHLSTLMCPVHRQKVIKEIRDRLEHKRPCRVVSTRLIEAGVDVDFPMVFRSLCGLDSIVQSAGRCNREGRLQDEYGHLQKGKVFVFKPEDEFYRNMPPSMLLPIEITREIMRNHQDMMSPVAIRAYFEELYFGRGEDGLDVKGIMDQLEKGIPNGKVDQCRTFNYNFKQIADEFKLIQDNTYSIIIPYDEEAIRLINKLDYVEELRGTIRSLQPYTVNIFSNEFESLNGAGKLKIIANDMAVLRSKEDYGKTMGIDIEIKSGIGVFY